MHWRHLFDCSGGVAEWCEPAADDAPGTAVVRGGSWHATATSWRTAFRRDYAPDYRGISIGMRLVRTV